MSMLLNMCTVTNLVIISYITAQSRTHNFIKLPEMLMQNKEITFTSNNQRLGSAFDDLDLRLTLLCVCHPPLQKNLPDTHLSIH